MIIIDAFKTYRMSRQYGSILWSLKMAARYPRACSAMEQDGSYR